MCENVINIGKINISSLVKELISKKDIDIATYKISHKDFGELCDEEVRIQSIDFKNQDRKRMKLFGIYESSNKYEFYIIVNEDRTNTKILLCSEYEKEAMFF